MAMCPGDTTQWEDIHVKMGNFAPRPKTITNNEVEQQLLSAAEQVDPLEHKTLEELVEKEDDVEEDFMESYRRKRMQELREHRRGRFGQAYPLIKNDFIKEVNEASQDSWVCVHLAQEYISTSARLSVAWKEVAARFTSVKFMEGVASKIVERFPDASCPAIFLYKDGECKHQIVGPENVGGARVSTDSLEWLLSTYDVVKTELEENPLLDGIGMGCEEAAAANSDLSDNDDARGYSQLRIGNLIRRA
eukprot:GEMP01051349.1.p1 GENE.GEMP01051349.1~~GEMP01051349.1.p1  ORF type:complete len:248 (+),score=68.77 GEMP01051349.1:130-873(+)